MNAIVKASPLEAFRQQVLPPEKAVDLWKSLPAHIRPAVFERNLMNALMANPELAKFHPSLVYREVCKAAGLGLLLDPQLGEAYIVVAYNYKSGNKEPQLRIGYKGMCKLARQAGDVTNIYAHEVCAKDPIVCHLGTDKKLVHSPDLFGDRGPVIGYYAVIKFNDDVFDFEPMSLKQVRDIRDRSDAWKAFKAEKIKSTPWSTDEDEMAKKTVLRRLMKRQPQSPELAEAIGIEDTAEFPNMRPAVPEVTQRGDDGPPLPPPAKKLAPPEAEAPAEMATEVTQASQPPETQDPEAILKWIDQELSALTDGEQLDPLWNGIIASVVNEMFPPDQEEALGLFRKHEARLAP